MSNSLVDVYGREVNYLRLSVTENCNLSCFYCRSSPETCGAETVKEELLQVEEIYAVVKAAVELGMSRVRLTGGEPLLRPDILDIVRWLASLKKITDLSLTTNGMLLDKLAFKLADAGLTRVNISLDSLEEANFKKITNGGKLSSTLSGIQKSLEAGLTPVKINMVLLKGINEHEIASFIKLTQNQELDVRFIEYMPVSEQDSWGDLFLPLDRVVEEAAKIAPLISVEGDHGGGPARYYRLQNAVGKIGLISPLSRHFCDRCNRLRVTSDGRLKPCLFSEEEVDLRPYLDDTEKLKKKFVEALIIKPDPEGVSCDSYNRMKQFKGKRTMTQIGG